MKNTVAFKVLFFSLFIVLFSACEEEDDSLSIDAVWNNQFYFGNTYVSNQSVVTSEVETTSNFIDDIVCYSALPNGNFSSFTFMVYIPKSYDSNVLSGLSTTSNTIYYNGTSINISESYRNLSYLYDDYINDTPYAVFQVSIYLSSNGINISKDTFQQMYYGFDMIHKDAETGEEFHRDDKFIRINISGC